MNFKNKEQNYYVLRYFYYFCKKNMNFKTTYIIMTIRKFAEHYSIAWKESYQYLKKYGGISFLDDCYEAEHTLSFDDAIEDLTRVCENNGGGLKYA